MSLKIYNKETGKWEKQTSMLATSIEVIDVANKFESETSSVENCLSELKDDFTKVKADIKYIKENGCDGGHGSGGGSGVGPEITLMYPNEGETVSVNTTQKVVAKYKWKSTNRGSGTAILTDHNLNSVQRSVNPIPAEYTWELGPFTKSTKPYNYSIEIVDSNGYASSPAMFSVLCGALNIESAFGEYVEFAFDENVIYPLNVEAPENMDLVLRCTYRGAPHPTLDNTPITPGAHSLQFGKVSFMGSSRVTFMVESKDKSSYSQTLSHDFVVADSKTLTITSSFESEFTWAYGNELNIDYRISKKGEHGFITSWYIDDMENPIFTSDINNPDKPSPNKNYWPLGNRLEIRPEPYHLRIKATTLDGSMSKDLDFMVTVALDGFSGQQPVPGAIAYFRADSMPAAANTWRSEIGNMTCQLYGLNNITNGFAVLDPTTNTTRNTLTLEGQSYGIIDYSPFANGIGDNGFTFEITYKVKNTGDHEGRVVEAHNGSMIGFTINTENVKVQTSSGTYLESGFEEDEWVTQTIVYDPFYKTTPKNPSWTETSPSTVPEWLPEQREGVIKVFTNGCISSVDYFDSTTEGTGTIKEWKKQFIYSGKIVLGVKANHNASGNQIFTNLDNFGSCEIKSIRMYDKYLNDIDVLKNYISIQTPDEQRRLLKLNELNSDVLYDGIPIFSFNEPVDVLKGDSTIKTTANYQNFQDTSVNISNVDVEVAIQGTSSKEYPTKNYTVHLKTGDGGAFPYVKYAPDSNWLPESRWTLKANYMDSSQANNVSVAKFVHSFFLEHGKDGKAYPQQLINPKTRACVDGIPMRLRQLKGNDYEELGLYTFNIDRYANQNYGFETYEQLEDETGKITGINIKMHPAAVSYEFSGNNTAASAFRTEDFEIIKTGLKHRYNFRHTGDTKVYTTVTGENNVQYDVLLNGHHPELMTLMGYMNKLKSAAEFRATAKDHWDVDFLIDYFLICQMFGLVDSLGKNMVITTWGEQKNAVTGLPETIWYPSFYDSDTAFGVNNQGQIDVSSGVLPPNLIEDLDENGNVQYDKEGNVVYKLVGEFVEKNSKLWEYITHPDGFLSELVDRYKELTDPLKYPGKNPPLSYNNLIQYVEGITTTIGQKYYNEDAERKYIRKKQFKYMCNGSRISFTKKWLRERCNFMDSFYETAAYIENKVNLRSNVGVENQDIRIVSYQPIMIKFQPNDGGKPMKVRCDKNGVTLNVSIVNDDNNNATFCGAPHILSIDGLNKFNISFLDISHASKLTNIYAPENKILTQIEMRNNPYLRKINLNGCTKFGSDPKNSILDISKCPNLREIDVTNCPLKGLTLPTNGGYIDKLIAVRTNIASLDIKGQTYLKWGDQQYVENGGLILDTETLQKLSSLTIESCPKIEFIKIERSKLNNLSVKRCENLAYITINKAEGFNSISTELCNKLEKLTFTDVSGVGTNILDLTSLMNLKELIISSSDVRHIKFAPNAQLKALQASSSRLISIGFGINSEFTENDALDLTAFQSTLTTLSLSGCSLLKEVKGLDFSGNVSFSGCTNIKAIRGRIHFKSSGKSLNSNFYECSSLTVLPTITFDTSSTHKIQSITSMFYGCSKLTWDNVVPIFNAFTTDITSIDHMFYACSGLKGPLPTLDPLPNTTQRRSIFANAPNLTSIRAVFRYCGNITGGIDNVLNCLTSLSDMELAFDHTSLSEEVKYEHLKDCTKLYKTQDAFSGCKITVAPKDNLFDGQRGSNSNLQVISNMFNGCPMEGEIPKNIFKRLPKLTSVHGFFAGSKLTGEIPGDLLDCNSGKANKITSVGRLFENNSTLTCKIPAKLLTLSPEVDSIYKMFNGCSGITGPIPANFLSVNNAVKEAYDLFNGCSSLGTGLSTGEINEIPMSMFKNKTALTRADGMFRGCSKLGGQIKPGMFDDCISLSNISNMFNGCTNLSGSLPQRISHFVTEPVLNETTGEIENIEREVVTQYGIFDNSPLSTVNGVFANCTSISGQIPETFFINGSAILSMEDIFYRCYNLTGGIPEKLFKNCRKVSTMNRAFMLCRRINETQSYEEEGIDPVDWKRYVVPPKLFEDCVDLITANQTFYMWEDRSGQPLYFSGEIPPRLFEKCKKLQSVNSLFTSAYNITGHVDHTMFNSCTNLVSVNNVFRDCSGLQTMSRNLFSTIANRIDFTEAFRGCSGITGQSFDINQVRSSGISDCFTGTNVSNYTELANAGWARPRSTTFDNFNSEDNVTE